MGSRASRSWKLASGEMWDPLVVPLVGSGSFTCLGELSGRAVLDHVCAGRLPGNGGQPRVGSGGP